MGYNPDGCVVHLEIHEDVFGRLSRTPPALFQTFLFVLDARPQKDKNTMSLGESVARFSYAQFKGMIIAIF